MNQNDDTLLNVVSGFYSAGFGESGWSGALDNLVQYFDAGGANIFTFDREKEAF